MERLSSERTNCETCQHYRPQVSFVDTWKRSDEDLPRKAVVESLREVRKAETEALESEVELLFELVRGEVGEWPYEPRFAPYCHHGNKVQVAALKNQAGRCTDHELARNRDHRACQTCVFNSPPATKIGDRHENIQGYMNQGLRDHVRQQNKDKEDAEAAALGLEIEQSFYSDGQLPVVSFLHTCGAKRSGGRFFVAPFANLRSQCIDHTAFLRLPPVLTRVPRTNVDPEALELTLQFVRLIEATHSETLDSGVRAVATWMERFPGAESAALWARRGFARWGKHAALSAAALDDLPDGRDGHQLLPFIAGADVFEWGWLARTSHHDPIMAAKIAAQQVSEFFAATTDPLDLIAAIEGYEALLSVGVFAPAMVEALHTFTRRLSTVRVDLELVIRVDLVAYYELIARKFSYSVSKWLRTRPTGAGAIIGDFGGVSLGDRVLLKAEQAKADGEQILARIANLGDPEAQPLPAQFLDQLVKTNQEAIEFDIKEQKDLFKSLLAGLSMHNSSDMGQQAIAKFLGLPAVDTSPTGAAVEQVFGPIRKVELPRRHLFAWLVFRRGALPVTPSACDFEKNKTLSRWVPASLEQAILEPASRNLESTSLPPMSTRSSPAVGVTPRRAS